MNDTVQTAEESAPTEGGSTAPESGGLGWMARTIASLPETAALLFVLAGLILYF